MNVNIMMIGGRRCGKTSVLAAMQGAFDREFGKSNLTVRIAPESITTLNDKLEEINQIYANKENVSRFTPNDNHTFEKQEHKIKLSLKSKPNGDIQYTFIDIPGEWFEDKPQTHAADISDIVKSSSVIIVAIDTPFLMEEAASDKGEDIGKYNEYKNHSKTICEFLKDLDLDKERKMVIFVPLKAERYLHDGKMNLVKQRVYTAYRSFFDHVDNNFLRNKCTTVIAPIFTFGTVEFTRFEREGSEIIIDKVNKYPSKPLYGFTNDAGNAPEAKYCEQPLLYVLLYVLKSAEIAKKRKTNSRSWRKIFDLIGENFFKMPSAQDFLNESKNIQKSIKTEGDGYEIVTDAIGFKQKEM